MLAQRPVELRGLPDRGRAVARPAVRSVGVRFRSDEEHGAPLADSAPAAFDRVAAQEVLHPRAEVAVEPLGVPIGDGRKGHGGGEPLVEAGQQRRHEPAVAAAEHADLLRIGDPHLQHVVDAGEEVLRVGSAHVARRPARRNPVRVPTSRAGWAGARANPRDRRNPVKVPGQESANAHTGPPWTSRISGNGPSPCGSVRKPWISRPSGAVHESTVREATLDRTTSVPSLLVETIVRGSWPETTTSSGGRAAELSAMTMSSPTGAAARKNRPPASLVAHRSFAIPAVDVDLEDDRLQTADAGGDQDPVGSPGEERDIDTQRVGPANRRRRRDRSGARSPATTRRSLQTASTTATTSPVGELDTHPSCTSDSKSVRSVPADVSIITTRASVPGALARFLGRDRDDAVVLAPVRLPDVEVGATRRPELTGGHLHDHQAPTGAIDAVEGLHLRDPRRQVLGLADHARTHRIGLLGLETGHHDQDRGPVGRPGMELGDALHHGKRPRLADRVHVQGVELVAALRRPVGSERQRPAVGRPARLVVVVRTVGDLAHPGSIGRREADPADGCVRPAAPTGRRGTRCTFRRGRGADPRHPTFGRTPVPGPAG